MFWTLKAIVIINGNKKTRQIGEFNDNGYNDMVFSIVVGQALQPR